MTVNCNYEKMKEMLLDDESKKIFDARIEYLRTEDIFLFIKRIQSVYNDFRYPELESFLRGWGKEEKHIRFVIFGAGHEGEIAFEILKHTKYSSKIYAFCDNNKELWGKKKQGLYIKSIYELLAEKQEIIYILASNRYNNQFLRQLLALCVPQKNIFISPFGGYLFAQRGWQYFDVFSDCGQESFIDAGAYDGMTSKDFLKWCHGKYNGIYMFEPNSDMESVCFANTGINKKIRFIGKAVWNKNLNLHFYNEQNSSVVMEAVNKLDNLVNIPACSIDSELKDKEITFIKMDVEGSELKALQGAQRTIKELRPKLAISVYHKLNDIVNIMDYLIDLNPKYRYYLRHYSGCQWETVLYAIDI